MWFVDVVNHSFFFLYKCGSSRVPHKIRHYHVYRYGWPERRRGTRINRVWTSVREEGTRRVGVGLGVVVVVVVVYARTEYGRETRADVEGTEEGQKGGLGPKRRRAIAPSGDENTENRLEKAT